MIIFGLLLVLFAGVASAGYCFGAIRAAVSFFGLFVALILAHMFAHKAEPIVAWVGVKNPVLLWMYSPIVVFILAMIVFKIIGFVIQSKVNLYYKYKAGDLRMSLWNRLNPRLGLVVGLANATIYMVLLTMVIYVAGYPASQIASDTGNHWSLRLLNQAGHELDKSGLSKVALAVNPMPSSYYQAADLAGLLYHNDLLEARLGRYPVFISLGEEPIFQAIATNRDFRELRQKHPPISEILNNPLMQPIVGDPAMLKRLWGMIEPNIEDIEIFLNTYNSPKYSDQKLVGRWDINLPASLSAYQENHGNVTPRDMTTAKREIRSILTNSTTLTATLEKQIYLKNIGDIQYVTNVITRTTTNAPPRQAAPAGGGGRGGRGGGGRGAAPAPPTQPVLPTVTSTNINVRNMVVKFGNLQGSWSESGTNFTFNLNRSKLNAAVDGDKLYVEGLSYPMVFERQY